MSINYILDNINYELIFENGSKLSGNIDYVSHHFSDGIVKANFISNNQMPEIKAFLNAYNEYNMKNSKSINIIDFYHIWNKGE